MGCGTSQVPKTERSNSQVTIESQQRTVAAYRRQRIARDMEQIASLRAQAEVEKALMLKRSSLGSVDDRRPSYVMRVLEDLAEVEEGQEEIEEKYSDPVILNGTYHNENKLAEQEHNINERNIALHSSVTQPHSVTPGKELQDDSNFNKHTQIDKVNEDQNGNDWDIVLHNSVTQENSVTSEENNTHAQNYGENGLDSAEKRSSLFTINESNEESSMDFNARTQNNKESLKTISNLQPKEEEERGEPGIESQEKTIFDGTAHVQEIIPQTDHNLTNHDREETDAEKKDEIENIVDGTDENLKDKREEKDPELEEENELGPQRLERNGLQESTDLPDISQQVSNN